MTELVRLFRLTLGRIKKAMPSGFQKGHRDFVSKESRKRAAVKIGIANTGKRRSDALKKRMSEARKGKPVWWMLRGLPNPMQGKKTSENPQHKQAMVEFQGKANPAWKGNKVGYTALHQWVYKKLGQPRLCEHCGNSDLKPRQYHWANKSRKYKRNVTDWIRLCASCHKKYDNAVS